MSVTPHLHSTYSIAEGSSLWSSRASVLVSAEYLMAVRVIVTTRGTH